MAQQFDSPTQTDVSRPAPIDGKKRKHPAFLTRLAELLRSSVPTEVFAAAVAGARAHAGGTAKAERRAAEGEPSGVIVTLPVPAEAAALLAISGGLVPEDLHITLVCLGTVETLGTIQQAEALLAMRDAAQVAAPLTVGLSGIGRFQDAAPGQDAVVALVDSPALNDLWDIVCDELEEVGIDCEDDHGFTPHVTLAYIDAGAPLPIDTLATATLRLDTLALWAGTARTATPLLGLGDDGDGDADESPGMDLMASSERVVLDYDITPYARAFAEAPAWIPYLPRPGVYPHPKYGDIHITRERNARFATNFARQIYQDRIPIDLEHETKLSGAAGWIVEMRLNEDGSADARVDWTDRGRQALAADRFKFFSPEWYDRWQSPIDGAVYQDVAIGGALTTRPFFKGPALRPLVASEHGRIITEGDPMAEQNTQSFAELQQQVDALKQENTALKQAGETTAASNKHLAEQIAAMQADARTQRFSALVRGTGDSTHPHRWFGDVPGHVEVLNTFAQTFGEDSAQFKAYVTQQQALAAQIATSAAFAELGSDGSGKAESAWAQIERKASELRAAEPTLTPEQATTKVMEREPALYRQYQAETA